MFPMYPQYGSAQFQKCKRTVKIVLLHTIATIVFYPFWKTNFLVAISFNMRHYVRAQRKVEQLDSFKAENKKAQKLLDSNTWNPQGRDRFYYKMGITRWQTPKQCPKVNFK